MTDPILVADIGGTNARFAIARRHKGAIAVSDAKKFRAEEFNSLQEAALAYLNSVKVTPSIGCFAVAGPVTDEQVEFTNSPWVLNIPETKTALGLKQLLAVNDFEALASGVQDLRDVDLETIKPGRADAKAPILVLGPGTGFGQALIAPFGDAHKIIPTEGGHVSFAPHTDEELEVLRFLMREHPRVFIEMLMSGPGLVTLYRALCALNGARHTPLQSDAITAAASDGSDRIALMAVNMFCGMLGGVAGDAVLSTGSRGGVILGGGILPKIRDLFSKSSFVDRFIDKGRMKFYIADVPVRMIVTEETALRGAATAIFEADGAR